MIEENETRPTTGHFKCSEKVARVIQRALQRQEEDRIVERLVESADGALQEIDGSEGDDKCH